MNHMLGIRFLPTDDESVLGEMPINENTVQYFGILHGGAALAMAETLAGAGSLAHRHVGKGRQGDRKGNANPHRAHHPYLERRDKR